MKYERLTRFLTFEVNGEEYSSRLTLEMLEKIESALPEGITLVGLILKSQTPTIKVMKEAFCVGLHKDGKKLSYEAAAKVFQAFYEAAGMPYVLNVFYALIAASYFLGEEVSNNMLREIGLIVKDEETEKNV